MHFSPLNIVKSYLCHALLIPAEPETSINNRPVITDSSTLIHGVGIKTQAVHVCCISAPVSVCSPVKAKFQANTNSHPAGINLLPLAQTGRQTFPHEATQADAQSREGAAGQSGRRLRVVNAVSQLSADIIRTRPPPELRLLGSRVLRGPARTLGDSLSINSLVSSETLRGSRPRDGGERERRKRRRKG